MTPTASPPLGVNRRWLLASATAGAGLSITGAWSLARRPAANAPSWWPTALCLGDSAVMTPAKLKRAAHRLRRHRIVSPADAPP